MVNNNNDLNLTGGTLSQAVSGNGKTTVTGSTTNNAGINQEVTVNNGVTLTNNAALGSSAGAITNSGTINTNASNIKGKVTNNNSLNISGGTLSQSVSGTGKTTVSGTVISNSLIAQSIDITITGDLTTHADNVGGSVNNDGILTLTGGTLNESVTGAGSLGIAGNVINNDIISQNIVIKENGNLTNNNNIGNVVNNGILTSKGEYLTGTIENNKILNLSGTIGKTVSGSGTTYVANSLTFTDGADIENILNLAELSTLTTGEAADSNYAIGTLTGNGDVNIKAGNLLVDNSADLNKLTNSGNISVGETLTTADNISNSGTLTVSGKTKTQDIENSGIVTLKNGVEAKNIINNGKSYITGLTNVENNITNNEDDIFNTNGNVQAKNITNNGDMDILGNMKTEILTSNTSALDITGNLDTKDLTNSGIALVGGDLISANLVNNTNSLTVNGYADLHNVTNSGILTIKNGAKTNDITNDNIVSVTGDVSANKISNNKQMTVNGELTTSSDIINKGSLEVTKNLNIAGILENTDELTASGNTSAKSLTNSGTAGIGGNLTVTENIRNTKDLSVTGKLTSQDIENTGILTVENGADVNDLVNRGNVKITGDTKAADITNNQDNVMFIDGNTTAGNITNQGDLDITGNAKVENLTSNTSELDVTGNLETKDLTNSGTALIGGELISTNLVNNTNSLTINGHADLHNVTNSGTLTIKNGAKTNDITNDNIISVTGDVSANKVINNKDFTVTGSLTAASNVTNKGSMDISADLTTAGALENTNFLKTGGNVSADSLTNNGIAEIGGNLTVTENIQNSDALTVTGKLTSKDLENTGILNLENGAIVNNFTNSGEVHITGDLGAADIVNNQDKIFNVTGNVNADNVTNHGDMDISGNLIVANTINNTGDLDVLGTATAKEIINTGNFNIGNEASVSITGNLTATEDIETSGLLNVIGKVTARDLSNEGTLIIGNGAEVQDFTNDGSVNITGDLSARDIINSSEKVFSVNGKTTARNITNNGDMDLTGDVIVESLISNSSALDVTGSVETQDLINSGITNISGDLTSKNLINNTNSLTVDGYADLNKVVNDESLTLNNGAEIETLTNNKNLSVYKGLNSNYIENNGILDLTDGNGSINNIQNNSQINITNASYNLTNTITGNGDLNITNSEFTTNGEIQNQKITADNSVLNFSDNSKVLKDSVLDVVNGSVVNTKDGVYTDYVMDELHSSADTRYSIDLVLTKDEQKADTFTLENGGSGIVYISSINVGSNVINESDMNESYVIQIIKAATGNAPQLDYDESKVLNQATANMTSDIILAKEFGLASTTNVNDSLEIRGLQDTFVAWANYVTPVYSELPEQEDKSFTFVDNSTSILSKDVSEFKGYNLTINGADNTYDVNGKDLMSSINKEQNITISNINFKNNNDTATDNKGILNLNNVTTDKDIVNNNELNMTGNIGLKDLTNNGNMSFEGAKWAVGEFVNTAESSITGYTQANNITNSGSVDIDGNVNIEQALTNERSGDIVIDGTVMADKINNEGEIRINDNVNANDITNTGTTVIKGDTSVSTINNTSGSTDITGDLIVENVLNDDNITITGNFDTNKITNNGTINVNDSTFNVLDVVSEKEGVVNITNTKWNPYNVIENQNITAQDSIINVYNPYNMINNSLALNQSVVNIGDLTTEPMHFSKLSINDGSTININTSAVDFTTNTMGRITADEYTQAGSGAVVNLYNLNILNNIANNVEFVEIPFADMSFADKVKYHGQAVVYTPVYQYGASYNYKDGNMVFARGGYFNPDTGLIEGSTNPSDSFNPSVLSSAVGAQIAAAGMMNQTFNYAFQNSDNFMLMPEQKRLAEINKNKTAIAGSGDYITGYNNLQKDVSTWYKPYVSFESIPLRIGPKVSSTTYGSLVGFDTPFEELKNGWVRTFTVYGGYNGANARYKQVDITQNGAALGGTITLYKGNFFNATTLSTGVTFSENSTMFGSEDNIMLLGGVGNKTGYNLEFKDGRFIIQPNLLLSYTFVKTFDYKNAAGIQVESDPLHAIQVAPGVKFIANTKHGWQPYLAANMVMNFMDKSNVTADNVRLPEMSIRPYVQYGLGIQKTFKDNFMGFGSVMLQNGGRNGVALNFGLRWALDFNRPFDNVKFDEPYRHSKVIVLMPDIPAVKPVKNVEKKQKPNDDEIINIEAMRTNDTLTVNNDIVKNKNIDKNNVVKLQIEKPEQIISQSVNR